MIHNTTLEKKKYLSSIVVLRGIAALVVCLFHFTKGYSGETSFMRSMWSFAWSGVEIFFVISGFVIPYGLLGTKFKISNYGGFLKKRFVRIEPAYLVSIVVVLLLNYFSTLVTLYEGDGFSISPVQLGLHIGYLVDIFGNEWLNPAYWTLAVELQYYLLIGVLIALWNLKNKYITIVSLLAFLLLSFLPSISIRFFSYTDVFTIGIIGAFYKKEWISRSLFLLLTIGIAAVIFVNHGMIIFAVTLISAVIIAFLDTLTNNRALLFLGNISYSLYLLHIPVGGRIVNLAKRFETNEVIKVLVVLVALGFSIFVAWIFYRLIEKPSHKWSKRIKLKLE